MKTHFTPEIGILRKTSTRPCAPRLAMTMKNWYLPQQRTKEFSFVSNGNPCGERKRLPTFPMGHCDSYFFSLSSRLRCSRPSLQSMNLRRACTRPCCRSVAEYAVDASQRAQVILTTHSPQFLDAFGDTMPVTTVTECSEGRTQLRTLDGDALKEWVKEYSLGSLFLSSELPNIR